MATDLRSGVVGHDRRVRIVRDTTRYVNTTRPLKVLDLVQVSHHILSCDRPPLPNADLC